MMGRNKTLEEVEESIPARDREQTEIILRATLKKFVEEKKKISIKAVAEAAGYTGPLIHNKYPKIATEIRNEIKSLTEKDERTERRTAYELLREAKEKIREQAAEIEQLKYELRDQASINEVLRHQLSIHHGVKSGKVRLLSGQKSKK